MCGRYTLTLDERLLREIFDVSLEGLDYVPNYNIFPGSQVPVILARDASSGKYARQMRWGLIPRWAKGPNLGYKMINARAETVHQKPAYKKPFAVQRCLVPADGFYEWQKQNGRKIPYRITLPEGKPFAFAGLWDKWVSREGEEVFSFTIVTTEANASLRDIHNRMPVILEDNAHWDTWLSPDTCAADLLALMVPYPEELVADKVSTLVNSPKNNFPDLIKAVEDTVPVTSEKEIGPK